MRGQRLLLLLLLGLLSLLWRPGAEVGARVLWSCWAPTSAAAAAAVAAAAPLLLLLLRDGKKGCSVCAG